jgi:hypothetical protein
MHLHFLVFLLYGLLLGKRPVLAGSSHKLRVFRHRAALKPNLLEHLVVLRRRTLLGEVDLADPLLLVIEPHVLLLEGRLALAADRLDGANLGSLHVDGHELYHV